MPSVDYISLITSLREHVQIGGPFWVLVQAICWCAGCIFGLHGFGQLKEVAEGQRHGYKAPITSFVAAAMMISSPELIKAFMVTAYTDEWGTSPLAYVKDAQGSNQSFFAILTMVTFIGYIFFIRGIWILKESGEPQKYHQSSVGKAIVVMGAGMAAIYIDFTLKVLANTFGFDLSTYIGA